MIQSSYSIIIDMLSELNDEEMEELSSEIEARIQARECVKKQKS